MQIGQGTVNWAGHKIIRAGRKTVRAGRSTLRNMPSWNTVIIYISTEVTLCLVTTRIYISHTIYSAIRSTVCYKSIIIMDNKIINNCPINAQVDCRVLFVSHGL